MDKHMEAALAKVQVLFEQAAARIDALKVGEKVPATVLADEIATLHGMKGPSVYPLLKIYFDSRSTSQDADIEIRRGAVGGLIKIK